MFQDVFLSFYKEIDHVQVLPHKELSKAVKALGFHSADLRTITGGNIYINLLFYNIILIEKGFHLFQTRGILD